MAEEKNQKIKRALLEKLKEYCPKEYLTRKEIQEITGGSIKSSTLRQLDYEGRGIANRKVIGSITVYDIDDVITWLEANIELIGFEKEKPVKKSLLAIDELLLMKKRVKRRTR